MKLSAEDLALEEATAVTVWTTSLVPRRVGSMSMSLTNISAIQPVAMRDCQYFHRAKVTMERPIEREALTHDTPSDILWRRHDYSG